MTEKLSHHEVNVKEIKDFLNHFTCDDNEIKENQVKLILLTTIKIRILLQFEPLENFRPQRAKHEQTGPFSSHTPRAHSLQLSSCLAA